jgi:hypothetical protein
VRTVFETEATRSGSTLAPFLRHTLTQLVKQGWPRSSPIIERRAEVIERPPAAAPAPSPAAPSASLDVTGRPRAPDAFDSDDYQPPPAVRRGPDPNAAPRWRYRPST